MTDSRAADSEEVRRLLNDAGAAFRGWRLEEAEELVQRALEKSPDHPGGRGLAGVIAHLQGDNERARRELEEAVRLAPEEPEYRANLARLLLDGGQAAAALQSLRGAPDTSSPDLRHLEARALERTGRAAEALARYLALLEDPEFRPAAEARLLEIVTSPPGGVSDTLLEEALREMLRSPGMDTGTVSVPLARFLLNRHDPAGARAPLPDDVAGDALLIEALDTLYFAEAGMEGFLTALRRELLEACLREGRVPAGWQPIMGGLAVHNLRNEAAFAITERESESVNGLARKLEAALEERDADPGRLTGLLLLVGLYRSPDSLAGAQRLADVPVGDWPEPVRPLMRLAFEEPARERELAESIAVLKPLEDQTSLAVRAMYEEHPYPRWDRLGPVYPGTVAESLARQLPGFQAPQDLAGENVPVLIAGCGTGRHALRAAMEYTNARVTAIDISRRSLVYAARKARELGVDNVEFIQADLFDLPELDTRFPVIETIGTLETLDDPEAGWRVIVDMLAPGGLMYVGSYSETARRPVAAARERISELGLDGGDESMRAFRQRLMDGDLGAHGRMILSCGDFYSLSGCRDFLFHVRERRFTVRELTGLWKRMGLEFLGFHPVPPAIAEAFRQRFPGDPEGRHPETWIEFEETDPDEFCRLMNLSMLYYWLRKPSQ